MTMAWWQLAVLAGLVVALAYAAAVLYGRRRTFLFLLVTALAGALTWVSIGLLLGGIAPGRTNLMLPADSGLVPRQNEALRQERVLYDALIQRHPEAAAKIAEIERLRANGAEAGMRRARLTLLASYLPVYAPRASDASIRAFAALAVENLQGLLTRDPLICRETAAGRHAAVIEELNQRAATALIDVLNSAMTQPQTPPDAAEAIQIRRQAIDSVYEQGNAGLVERRLLARSAEAPPDLYCMTFIRVFQRVLELPAEQGSKVLRFYYGQEGESG
jgi:2-oxo-4-hydroxy-4-carboxy--5-ureidoimidazoline (OHCU) decarboxylase